MQFILFQSGKAPLIMESTAKGTIDTRKEQPHKLRKERPRKRGKIGPLTEERATDSRRKGGPRKKWKERLINYGKNERLKERTTE